MNRLILLGAGGYGRTIADVARQLGTYDTIAFLDDTKSGENILGACEDYKTFADGNTAMYPAFGDNEARMLWISRLKETGIPIPSFLHPRAYVSPEAVIGEGTAVLPFAVVNTGVTVGAGCILNIGALVDHDTVIGDGVHLCPGVVVKARNRIPPMSRLESGTVIKAEEMLHEGEKYGNETGLF